MFYVGSNGFTIRNTYKFNVVLSAFNFAKSPCSLNQFINSQYRFHGNDPPFLPIGTITNEQYSTLPSETQWTISELFGAY